jgi:hypothetical protein
MASIAIQTAVGAATTATTSPSTPANPTAILANVAQAPPWVTARWRWRPTAVNSHVQQRLARLASDGQLSEQCGVEHRQKAARHSGARARATQTTIASSGWDTTNALS